MEKDDAPLDNSATAFLRLGSNDDLVVFEQDIRDAATGIGGKTGRRQVLDEAERRVRKVAEGASNDANDRRTVLLDCIDRIRREVESDGG